MNVCIVWHCRYPWDIRIEKFIGGIRRAGHRVVLLTKGGAGLAPRDDGGGIIHYRVPSCSLPSFARRCAALPLFFNPVWIAGIWRVARRERIDVFIVRDLPMALTVAVAGRLLGVRVIFDMAENYPAALVSYRKKLYAPFLVGNAWLPRYYERLALRLVDRVIVVAEEQRTRLVNAGVDPRRISIVGNTPDHQALLALGHAGARPDISGRYVLYSGFMDRHRGLRTLVLAFNELRDRYADLKLVMIGAGNESMALAQLARELRIEDRVIQKGWMDFREIPVYIRHSALCVIPHLKTEHTDTTVPNKLFDYLCFERPVIVSDAEPLRRIAGEMGSARVFPSGDHRALAAVMAGVLDENKPDACARRGRLLVESKYNWHNDEQNLFRALEE